MCDCPSVNKNNEIIAPETVTLFRKCSNSYRPPEDVPGKSSCDTASDKSKWTPDDDSRSEPPATVCNTTKGSLISSNSSGSSSSRTYKFISPDECECYGEAELPWEPPISIVEPCVQEEEVEEEPDIEHTLAIIKPEAVVYRKEIERRIYEEGFEISQSRWLQLTPEQVSEFYSDKYGQINFAHLVAYMASGPIMVHVLAKHSAVDDWKLLIGPTKVTVARLYCPDSIRARFGRKGEDFKNAVHGSNSRDEAEKEIHFFFPQFIMEPILRNKPAVNYLWEVINPVLVEALTLCCKVKPADPVLWLADWLIRNNGNKPKLPEDLTMIPT